MPTPNAVLCDIGNVVVRSTHQITFAALWDLGVRPDKAALFFHGKHYSDFARGTITGQQFAAAARDMLEAPHLTDGLIHAAHDAHIYAVDEVVFKILDALTATNVPLAFVTTTNEWQNECVNCLVDPSIFSRPLSIFGPIACSNKMRVTKTDDGAWPVILRTLKWQDRDPASILLVDDAKGNCDAAARAGLRVHQYDPTPVIGVEKLRIALREHGALP